MTYLPFTKPFVDEDTIAGVAEVLRSGWLATGPNVAEFERRLSVYVGNRIVKSFTSATGALEVALELCGIGDGDEVITPAMSFTATPNVIMRVGARPVFVDVELGSRNIDLDAVEKAITPRTRAIMPVHFAGLAVDCDRLYSIAEKHGLRVIEDAAHAIGTSWRGKRIGSFGDLVSFSFHPNKNMTTIEGGALCLSDPVEAKKLDQLRFHGLVKDEEGNQDVMIAGGKYNLSDVAARVGIGQLAHLDEFNEKRKKLVQRYFEQWAIEDCVLPQDDEDHSWHMFAPLIPFEHLGTTRGEFIRKMHEAQIGVGIHYPALHLFSLYRKLGYREGDFPNAEKIGRETVTLPLFPLMEESDVDRVCGSAARILKP